MCMMARNQSQSERRRARVRRRIRAVANGRARLSIHRSAQNIYAQIIDDDHGHTVVSASSLEKDMRDNYGGNCDAAAIIGKRIAERAIEAGVKQVIFDRGSYLFHGRIKALADAAREAGLSF